MILNCRKLPFPSSPRPHLLEEGKHALCLPCFASWPCLMPASCPVPWLSPSPVMHLGRGGQACPSRAAPAPPSYPVSGAAWADKTPRRIKQRLMGLSRWNDGQAHDLGTSRCPREGTWFSHVSQLLLRLGDMRKPCVLLMRKRQLRGSLCLTHKQGPSQCGFPTWGLFGSKTHTFCPALRLPPPSSPCPSGGQL